MTPGGNNFDIFFSGNQHNNLQILDATMDKDINKIQIWNFKIKILTVCYCMHCYNNLIFKIEISN